MKKSYAIRWFLIVAFISTTQIVFSQIKPTKEELSYAQELRKKFPKDDFYSTESQVKFSFEYSKDKKDLTPVKVNEVKSESIVRIKDGKSVSFANSVGYNNSSSVSEIKVYDKKGTLKKYDAVTQRKTYESSGIFHSDAKVFIYSLHFPDQGNFYRYDLFKRYEDVKYLTAVYFHEHYPIGEKTLVFELPEWVDVELKEMNMDGYDLIKSVTSDPKKKTTTYSFTLKKLEAHRSESNSPGPSFILPHILVLSKSYTAKDGSKQTLFNTTQDLYNWYAGLVKEIGNETDFLKNLVDKITASAKTDEEKIEAMFYWVQDNIRYIAFEEGIAGFKPEKCNKVFDYKYGDCKGMANLLKEMLITAGFDARLAWLGTRHIAYDYSIPSIAVDNHMICVLMYKGEKYFLDPTETYVSFGDVAHRIQGRQTIIENGDKFELAMIPEYSNEKNKVEIIRKLEVQDDLLVGESIERYNGEGKRNIMRGYNSIKTDKKEEALKNFLSGRNKNLS
ncbi:MAG: transglutaminase-like domain-containing protein, partial [Cytophagaceae bacterium]